MTQKTYRIDLSAEITLDDVSAKSAVLGWAIPGASDFEELQWAQSIPVQGVLTNYVLEALYRYVAGRIDGAEIVGRPDLRLTELT